MMSEIEAAECRFNNLPVKLVALKSIPKLDVAGEEVGPVEKDGVFEVRNWVADELLQSGVARLEDKDARLSLVEVQKTQIREIMQSSRRLSKLPEDFYPKLGKLIGELSREATVDRGKALELEKAKQLAVDILTSRMNKILLLSSSQGQSELTLKSLSSEERKLYDRIYGIVSEWREKVLNLVDG
jgi:Spy/CpxP family protein refolding chaperone